MIMKFAFKFNEYPEYKLLNSEIFFQRTLHTKFPFRLKTKIRNIFKNLLNKKTLFIIYLENSVVCQFVLPTSKRLNRGPSFLWSLT